jgi:HTH-type transcriptional regulator / antitoxin HigA
MNIKPIKTKTDYESTLSEISKLMDAEFGTPEGDRLDILVTLVEAYENKNFVIEAPDAVQAIQYVMEEQDLSRKDLEKYIGSSSRVSEILNYKRSLTLPMIRNLHYGLKIPAEVLIGKPNE